MKVGSFRLVSKSDVVPGNQGYAKEGADAWIFGSTSVVRVDQSGHVMAVNDQPFVGLQGYQHLGDGDIKSGRLLVVGEYYQGCQDFRNQSIFEFDPNTLQRMSVHDISAFNHEASAIAIIPGSNEAVVSSYCDPNRIFIYDTADFSLLRTIEMQQPVPFIQGIAVVGDTAYAATTNGKLYSIKLDTGFTTYLFSTEIHGEHEGIEFDGSHLTWLIVDDASGAHLYYYVRR